jgi:hypothetical protein
MIARTEIAEITPTQSAEGGWFSASALHGNYSAATDFFKNLSGEKLTYYDGTNQKIQTNYPLEFTELPTFAQIWPMYEAFTKKATEAIEIDPVWGEQPRLTDDQILDSLTRDEREEEEEER